MIRQPKPYGDCKSDWSETPYKDVFLSTASFMEDIPYSQGVCNIYISHNEKNNGRTVMLYVWTHIFQLCTRFCFFRAFAKAASCSHPRLINFPEQKSFWNVTRPCDLTNGGGSDWRIHSKLCFLWQEQMQIRLVRSWWSLPTLFKNAPVHHPALRYNQV